MVIWILTSSVLWPEEGFKLEFSDSHASALSMSWFKRVSPSLLHMFWKKAESSIALPQKRHWPLPLGGWILKSQRWLIPNYQRCRCGSVLDNSQQFVSFWDESLPTPTSCVGRLMHLSSSYGFHSGKDQFLQPFCCLTYRLNKEEFSER